MKFVLFALVIVSIVYCFEAKKLVTKQENAQSQELGAVVGLSSEGKAAKAPKAKKAKAAVTTAALTEAPTTPERSTAAAEEEHSSRAEAYTEDGIKSSGFKILKNVFLFDNFFL
jgi:hypothetical protein